MTENQNIIQSDETPAAALEADDIVLGGGNVKLLKQLPRAAVRGTTLMHSWAASGFARKETLHEHHCAAHPAAGVEGPQVSL